MELSDGVEVGVDRAGQTIAVTIGENWDHPGSYVDVQADVSGAVGEKFMGISMLVGWAA